MTHAMVVHDDLSPTISGARNASEMALHLAEVKAQMEVAQNFFHDVMVRDVDYGVIPGTDKPALLKPGAEKLAELYGYAPTIKHVEDTMERESGFRHVRVTIALVAKSTGETVAEGVGEATTHEGRYRWRWTFDSDLPAGVDKAALAKQTRRSKKTGKDFVMYRLENQDPWAQWNTVLKMAKKRALVDAVLSATRSSGLFSQDPDAFERWVSDGGGDDETPAGGTRREPFSMPQSTHETQPDAPKTAPRDVTPKADAKADFHAFWEAVTEELHLSPPQVREYANGADVTKFSQEQLDKLLETMRDVQPTLPTE